MAWQDKNPWEMTPEELAGAAGGGRAQQSRRGPSIIQGPPKTMEPGEVERLRLSQNADARAAEANARANAAAERAAAAAEKTAGSLNENQGKASGFYISARGAEREWKALEADPELAPGTQPVGMLGDVARAVLPTNIVNSNTSAARQRAQQAKENFIRASLRLESGAAIGKSEFDRQDRIFYPQTGDDPETLKQKARARQEVIDGFRIQAGPGAERVEALPSPASDNFQSALTPPSATGPRGEKLAGADEDVLFGDEPRPATAKRYTPEQEGQIAQAIRDGDLGQVLALHKKFSGNDPTPDTIRSAGMAIAAVKKDPNTRIGISYGAADASAQSAADKERFGDNLAPAMEERKDLIVDPIVRGVADVIPFSDEIAAAGDTVLGSGSYADNVRKERAIDEADSRVNNRLRFTGQMLGAALPVGRFLGFGRAGQSARSALNYGAEGAALGGLYAAGKADPTPEKTLGQALKERVSAVPVGAALGGGTAYGLAALGNAVRTRNANGRGGPPPGGQDAMDIAQSADAENIPISRPIVDPSRRDAMSYLESSIGGGGPVRRSLDATREGLETRAGELGGTGAVQAPGVIGERIQEAGNRYVTRSGGIGHRLYDRAAQMAGSNPVRPREAVRVIDEQIAELSGNANQNSPMIRYLQEVRGDLVDDAGQIRDKAIGDIRDIRTNLRGNINTRNLSATDAERRVGMVLDAARADIARDLGQAAPAAVRQYARADRFWRERQAEIKQVVQRVVGPRDNALGGEQVWQRVKTMSSDKGDAERLRRIWDKLGPEERADATATIAGTLGRRSAEEEFSPALFVNSVRGLSASARQTIFGPDGARSIANLRRVAEAYRDTSARLNNSRSGQVLQWGNFLRNFVPGSAIGAGGGAMVGGPAGAAVGAGVVAGGGVALRNLTARALMSPDMSRWLANAPRQTTPQAIQRHITQGLALVARRDPAIAQDALGLQRYLQEAISSSPRRAAAADEEKQ